MNWPISYPRACLFILSVLALLAHTLATGFDPRRTGFLLAVFGTDLNTGIFSPILYAMLIRRIRIRICQKILIPRVGGCRA